MQIIPCDSLSPQADELRTRRKGRIQKKMFSQNHDSNLKVTFAASTFEGDGHLRENPHDGFGAVMCKGFYVYLEAIISHNPLFRAIIVFAFSRMMQKSNLVGTGAGY
jgi:hypothetical protein